MAVESTQTYTKVDVKDLDVIPIYSELMKASVAKDSVYIRAKETMFAIFNKSQINTKEQAEITANMLTQIVGSITNQAMSTAYAIAKDNREGVYALTKLKADTLQVQEQTDLLAAQNKQVDLEGDLVSKKVDNETMVGWKVQADLVRENGIVIGNLPTLATSLLPANAIEDKGTKYAQERQIDSNTHSTLAKSVRESGRVKWTSFAPGDLALDFTPLTGTIEEGLTYAQNLVAIRQEKGFDDNMRQHAANASASFVAMLTSTDQVGVPAYETALGYHNTSLGYLTT